MQSALQFSEKEQWDNALGHARKSGEPALLDLITWHYALDADSGASFREIRDFIAANPHWPYQDRLQLRAEQALVESPPSDAELVTWFYTHPPISGAGKIAEAELLLKQGESITSEKIHARLREGWVNGDFEPDEEERLLARYRKTLRQQDHIDRADRLQWENKLTPAKRMLKYLPREQREISETRIALLADAKNANRLLDGLSSAQRNHAGIKYARLVWRDHHGLDSGVREMLLAAPSPLPYPEKWWSYRQEQVRELIDQRQYKQAHKLLQGHGLSEGADHAEATWLQGWLSLEFLKDPQGAYRQFYKLHEAVNYPVSKARGAYWAGRAAEKMNDKDSAHSWYTTAAAYPTTFYGQLASTRLYGPAPLKLPAEPEPALHERQSLLSSDIAQAIRFAVQEGHINTATTLLYHLIDGSKNPQQAALIAQLSNEVNHALIGVRAAKRALRDGTVLFSTGYPHIDTGYSLPVETPLAHAIVRQESEFDRLARSPAGARGMMQLLPSTAREVARKGNFRYTLSKLYDPNYNILLGSSYLSRLIDAYDGSYVLAIAAYNAGPGNVRKWLREYGPPGDDPQKVINWIERIPFAETRNYVQRVLENLQVYRHLHSDQNIPQLAIIKDLSR